MAFCVRPTTPSKQNNTHKHACQSRNFVRYLEVFKLDNRKITEAVDRMLCFDSTLKTTA